MKVLVTGGTGFVGGWLTKELAKEGHEVQCLVRRPDQCEELNKLGVGLIQGDVTDADSVISAAKGIDTVFHLAGVVGYSKAQRPMMDAVNIDGTKNVVHAVRSNSCSKLIYMSSVVAVGASFDGKIPMDETSKYNIKHLNLGYFETKRIAEEIVFNAVKNDGIHAVALNPSTIYGPGDAKKGSRKTQLKVAKGSFPFYTSGGVSIISVKDVVSAVMSAWDKGRSGERYILSGDNITIKQLFEIIAKHAGVKPPSVYLPDMAVHTIGKVGDLMESIGKKGPINTENAWTSTMFHWFSNEKAKAELGLNPMSANEAIGESVEWIQQQGWL